MHSIGRGKSNPGIFQITQKGLKINRIDKLVIIFDLDKGSHDTNSGNVMLKFTDILNKFEIEYSKTNAKKGINIMYPDKSDYIGNKVVLIPLFFCFESLFLYSEILFSYIQKINYNDFISCQEKILLDNNFMECFLSYRFIYEHNDFYPIYLQKFIKKITDSLLQNRFLINNRILDKKKTDKVFEIINKADPTFLIKELLHNLQDKAVFNKPFSELTKVSSDKDLDVFFNRYNFHNYKEELKNNIEIYNNMLHWNPQVDKDFQSLNWYQKYVLTINRELNSDKAGKFIDSLNSICTYYIK